MNGFSYHGGYDGSPMAQTNQYGGNESIMMGPDGVGDGMVGGQSLEEIVNQNAKAMRRQSGPQGGQQQPQQQYGTSPNHMDAEMRRIAMMDYNGGSPAASMGTYGFDASANMGQNAMMGGGAAQGQTQNGASQSKRHSGDLALNTSFPNTTSGYNTMMVGNSAFASPAQPQTGLELGINLSLIHISEPTRPY